MERASKGAVKEEAQSGLVIKMLENFWLQNSECADDTVG